MPLCARSWEEFAQTYSRLIRGVAIQAGLTEAEAKDVEQDTLVRVAKTIHEFESNPERGTFKGWLFSLEDMYAKNCTPYLIVADNLQGL